MLQYFDKEWGTYVDMEDYALLQDRTQLRCFLKQLSFDSLGQLVDATNVHLHETPVLISAEVVSPVAVGNVVNSYIETSWPVPYTLPKHLLPPQGLQALEDKLDLKKPKDILC
jgi:hypothetical protein